MVLRVECSEPLIEWFNPDDSSNQIRALASKYSKQSILLTKPRKDWLSEIIQIRELLGDDVADAMNDFYVTFVRALPIDQLKADFNVRDGDTWDVLDQTPELISTPDSRLKVKSGLRRNDVYRELFEPLAKLSASVQILDGYGAGDYMDGKTWLLDRISSDCSGEVQLLSAVTNERNMHDYHKRMLTKLQSKKAVQSNLRILLFENRGSNKLLTTHKILHERAISFKFAGARRLELTAHNIMNLFENELIPLGFDFSVTNDGNASSRIQLLEAQHGKPWICY